MAQISGHAPFNRDKSRKIEFWTRSLETPTQIALPLPLDPAVDTNVVKNGPRQVAKD
jgi:hypothetical protein